MKNHRRPEEETRGILFVRPASALGHMRQYSSDSVSLASVMGLSINVVELPQYMQVRTYAEWLSVSLLGARLVGN